jgi:hypothetical protein
MFNEGKLADIKIKTADGKEIEANKFILTRSPVFDAMLNSHDTKEAQEGVIEITDIGHEVMVEMVRYMYSDEIPKLKEIALELIVAGNKYDLPGLVDKIEYYLKHNITAENFVQILIVADKLTLADLKDVIVSFVSDNTAVFTSDVWKEFKNEGTHEKLRSEVMEKSLLNLHQKMTSGK